jgi:hypothetical protein
MCVGEKSFYEESQKPLTQRDGVTGPESSNRYVMFTIYL